MHNDLSAEHFDLIRAIQNGKVATVKHLILHSQLGNARTFWKVDFEKAMETATDALNGSNAALEAELHSNFSDIKGLVENATKLTGDAATTDGEAA